MNWELIYDENHPKKSPLLGRILSRLLCSFGHSVTVLELEEWNEPWLACGVCGARFVPTSVLKGGDSGEGD